MGLNLADHHGPVDPEHVEVKPGRRVYVHVARGALTVNRVALEAGDALKLVDLTTLKLQGGRAAEVLVFDLPGGEP